MIVVGAGGFAGEVADLVLRTTSVVGKLVMFDNVSRLPRSYDGIRVLLDENQVRNHFELSGSAYVLGLGGVALRRKMALFFDQLGGKARSIISRNAVISPRNTVVGTGTVVFDFVTLSHNVTIGPHCLLAAGASVSHDCVLGENVEIYPGARILGRVHIGSNVHIGANAIIFPNTHIGDNVFIESGCTVSTSTMGDQIIKNRHCD